MLKISCTLESWLAIHDSPFIVIDSTLKMVAVNNACENQLGITREQVIGQPCCHDKGGACRHQKLLQRLEPYAGIFSNDVLAIEQKHFHVRGYPLIDAHDNLYIVESLTPIRQSQSSSAATQMLGVSTGFLKLKNKLQQAAETLTPVFLTGETGTGKEIAAEFVHQNSKNAAGKFVVVDCTVLGENLFESELFGHEKGSFTGATTAKKGLFELANNGTLFLDEVGELPLSQQAKLLRALESGQFRRVGGTVSLRSNVRVVSATHRNIIDMVKAGSFREDLFYRLSVFPVDVPPLRDRLQDIPMLVDYILLQLGNRDGHYYSITQQALIKLMTHLWPGNIRELRNCLQLASGLCSYAQIDEKDIIIMRRSSREAMGYNENWASRGITTKPQELGQVEQMEASVLRNLIKKHNGNRKLIAIDMAVSERTLYRKLKRFNLN